MADCYACHGDASIQVGTHRVCTDCAAHLGSALPRVTLTREQWDAAWEAVDADLARVSRLVARIEDGHRG